MMKHIKSIICALGLTITLSASSCSWQMKKMDMELKENGTGTVSAEIHFDDAEKLREAAKTCDFSLKEKFGNDSKKDFIAEYKFDSYDQLQRTVGCSEQTQKAIVFHPIKMKDNLFSRESTYEMTLTDMSQSKGFLSYGHDLPEIINITIPGEVVSAKITPENGIADLFYKLSSTVTSIHSAQFNLFKKNFILGNITDNELESTCGKDWEKEFVNEEDKNKSIQAKVCLATLLDKGKNCVAPSAPFDEKQVKEYLGCAKANDNLKLAKEMGKRYGVPCENVNTEQEMEKCIAKYDQNSGKAPLKERLGEYSKITLSVTSKVDKYNLLSIWLVFSVALIASLFVVLGIRILARRS